MQDLRSVARDSPENQEDQTTSALSVCEARGSLCEHKERIPKNILQAKAGEAWSTASNGIPWDSHTRS